MFLGMARGKVGDIVFGRRLGQQTTRAYVSNVNDATTRSQVAQRSKLGNIVSSYRAYRTLLQRAFESKAPGVTDYNMFASLNLSASSVYLSKEAVSAGACIIAPYSVSKGTLPPIQVIEQSAGTFQSDIAVPAGFAIDATTTVAAFSAAVLSSNADWIAGDQFTAVHAEQYSNAQVGYPQASVRLYDVVLSLSDNTLLQSVMPASVLAVIGGYLGFTNPAFTGAVSAIHSRRDASGSLKVSSARMLLTSSNTIYPLYSGAQAMEYAVVSRGYNQGAYLDPGSEHIAPGEPITPGTVITSVQSGSFAWPADDELALGSTITIFGSGLDALDDTAMLTDWSGGSITLGTGTVSGSGRSFSIPSGSQGKNLRNIVLNGTVLVSANEGGGFIPDPNA